MGIQRDNRIYEFGEFRLNPQEHLLSRGQEDIPLSPRTFALLVKLVENAGHLLDKETLMREVWAGSIVEEGNLNRTISRLRKALGERPNEDQFIQTVPRVGYRFIAPVEEVSEANLTRNGSPSEIARVNTGSETLVARPKDKRHAGAERLRWVIPVVALGLVAVLISAYFISRNRLGVPGPNRGNANALGPTRLTDNPNDDTHPRWTKEGRIRFLRLDATREASSFIMNADGTNQSAVKDFPNLKFGVWSPDGQKVIFGKPNDRTALYLANASGANEISLPFAAGNYDWSFDSKHIVYQKTIENNVEVFVYSLETRESRNITNNPAFDADPSFGPNGEITFVSSRDGNNEIYVTQADRAGTKRLTNNPADDSHPVFSPDGTAIAFTSDRKGENADAYLLVNLDGSDNAIRLTNWESNETVEPGCWSPDGTKIVLFSDRHGKDDIYVMSAEALQTQAILLEGEKDLGFPSYSPDGRKIIYQSESTDQSGELRILDLGTNQTTPIVKLDIADSSPAWSPNGKWIAFQNRVESNTEICIIKSDGTGLTNLTNNPAKDISPAWSPDGKQIVFASNRDGSTVVFQLFLMNADGMNQHRIYYSNGFSSAPSWSPDGKEIVFANDKEDNRTGNFEIFVVEPETSAAEKRLTFRPRYDVAPVFSPDGKRIAFVSQTDGNSEIYLMNANGTALMRLTRNTAEDISPHWSIDGKQIIFSSNRAGRFALYQITVPNGHR